MYYRSVYPGEKKTNHHKIKLTLQVTETINFLPYVQDNVVCISAPMLAQSTSYGQDLGQMVITDQTNSTVHWMINLLNGLWNSYVLQVSLIRRKEQIITKKLLLRVTETINFLSYITIIW